MVGGSQVTALLKWTSKIMGRVFVVDECWCFHWSFRSAYLWLVRGEYVTHIGLPNGLGVTHLYTIYAIYLASLALVIYVPHNYWGISGGEMGEIIIQLCKVSSSTISRQALRQSHLIVVEGCPFLCIDDWHLTIQWVPWLHIIQFTIL